MKHWQDADIRMCMVPWETNVHIAYECIVEDPLSPKLNATALTRVETTFYPMKMDNIQIIKECDTVPGTLRDVGYVYNTHETTQGNSVAILHMTDSWDYKTVVEYPFGLIYDYSFSYWTLVQKSKIRRFSSLSIWDGNKIRLGGHYLPTTNRLVHLKQNRQFLEDKQWCIPNEKAQVLVNDAILYAEVVDSPLRKQFNILQEFLWGVVINAETELVETELTCYKQK